METLFRRRYEIFFQGHSDLDFQCCNCAGNAQSPNCTTFAIPKGALSSFELFIHLFCFCLAPLDCRVHLVVLVLFKPDGRFLRECTQSKKRNFCVAAKPQRHGAMRLLRGLHGPRHVPCGSCSLLSEIDVALFSNADIRVLKRSGREDLYKSLQGSLVFFLRRVRHRPLQVPHFAQ